MLASDFLRTVRRNLITVSAPIFVGYIIYCDYHACKNYKGPKVENGSTNNETQ
uniref:Uncharacterized protein n=1 Tax=Schistosoma japonicum TaxID=6182 RepID=C1LPS7_SCHJA|nr:hypothetical protein [Schistosoma japonicum]